MSLAAVYGWRDPLEVDASCRHWKHTVNHGSHNRELKYIEEKLIERARNERSARKERIDRKLVHIVVPETRGLGVRCLCHRWGPDAWPGFRS
jgi:hypothetical protein